MFETSRLWKLRTIRSDFESQRLAGFIRPDSEFHNLNNTAVPRVFSHCQSLSLYAVTVKYQIPAGKPPTH